MNLAHQQPFHDVDLHFRVKKQNNYVITFGYSKTKKYILNFPSAIQSIHQIHREKWLIAFFCSFCVSIYYFTIEKMMIFVFLAHVFKRKQHLKKNHLSTYSVNEDIYKSFWWMKLIERERICGNRKSVEYVASNERKKYNIEKIIKTKKNEKAMQMFKEFLVHIIKCVALL